MTGVVLVVGDVVDDIGVRPLGVVNPASDTVSEIRTSAGGSAANVATWLAHVGARVRFVGRVGVDAVQRHTAAMPGVDVRLTADPDLPTATIVLMLDESANRTMFVDRAANSTLRVEHLHDDVWDDVTWLHLTGYTFFDPATRPVAHHLIDAASTRGVGVSIDTSSLGFLEAAGRQTAEGWFARADLLFPNEDEARFLELDDSRSVLTLGPEGARYAGHAVAARPGDVIDTTGAGDAFCAGFLSVWVDRRDARAALAAGSMTAAECVAIRGARPTRSISP